MVRAWTSLVLAAVRLGALDARQQAWLDWKMTQPSDDPCVSSHTGMTYLLARPVPRRMPRR